MEKRLLLIHHYAIIPEPSKYLWLSSDKETNQTLRFCNTTFISFILSFHTANFCFYLIIFLFFPNIISSVSKDQTIKKVFSHTAIELIWTLKILRI